MRIHADFECGNARVLRQEGDTVYLQNEMRGTKKQTAYYWAFCVEGAEGRTLHFRFDLEWVGPYGAAVSHDLVNWHWSGLPDDGGSFTYTFGESESRVYFAHDLLYTPTRLFSFMKEQGIKPEVLCRSLGGRDIPFFKLGEGKQRIVLTSRHHACESSGTYVLEGVIREYLASPIEDTSLFVVPMMDYDGVCAGEHGKEREPHDHNRDYIRDNIYPEVGKIMEYAEQKSVDFAVDFHAPSHRVGRSHRMFIVRKMPHLAARFDRFAALFQKHSGGDAMKYDPANDVPPNTGWNKDGTPTFSTFFNLRPECRLALTLEVTHYGTEDNPVTADRLINSGRAFCRALGEFSENN